MKEKVMFDKITLRISKLVQPIEENLIDPTIVAMKVITSIYSGITTEELDLESAKICSNMVTINPAYGNLAGRILVSNLHKKTLNSFVEKMDVIQANTGLLDKEWFDWVTANREAINYMMDYEKDYIFDFFGFKTLEKSYLIKNQDTGAIYERPQDMFMRVASYICMGDLDKIKITYDMLANKAYTHASPTLFNAGTWRPQLSSCFLLGTNDSLEGITTTWDRVAQISKWAGGIGLHISNIRAKGSLIKGTNAPSSGIVPMLRVYNDIARYINQGGKRKGSFAIYLEPHHADVLDFLDLKRNIGDENERTRDLFLAMWLSDYFMEMVRDNGEWHLMCPTECPRLTDTYGDEYTQLYKKYVEEGKFTKVIKARHLMDKIMESQFESGVPYILFKDHANNKSNQKNIGTIKSSNLCVSYDTNIITKEHGIIMIGNLKDEIVEVWNGFEWSKVKIFQTGTNVTMDMIEFSNGESLVCTPEHKFHIKSQENLINASDLVENMEIIDFMLPNTDIIQTNIKVKNIIKNYNIGDTYCFTEPIKNLGVFNGIVTGQCAEILEVSNNEEHAVCNLASISLNHHLVPFKSEKQWTIYTKENCKYCNWAKSYFKYKGFDYVEKTDDPEKKLEEYRSEPECLDGACRRGIITYPQIFYGETHIGGFTDMIQFTADDYDYNELWRTAYIATINLDHVIDKNYYPTPETKCSNFRNRPIGLGIQGLADTLVSMKIPFESDMALRFNRNAMETIYNAALSASKDIAKSRYEDMEHFINSKVNIPEYYDKDFHLDDKMLDTIYHHHHINNCELKLVSHYGAYSSYVGSPMWEGKMQHDMWGEGGSVQEWDELREEVEKYGVRNSLLTALMPTASTSQIMGNNECFEWFTSNVYTRSTLAGEFPVVNKYLVNDLLAIGMWNDNMKQHIIAADGSVELLDIPPTYKELYKTMWDIKSSWVVRHARARAPFVDQTQSMNIYMAIPDDSKLYRTLMYAWEQGLKTGAYYVRTKPSGTIKFTVDASIERKVKEMNDAECTSCSA
jgi:ribonucleotide reductase alpha subunit